MLIPPTVFVTLLQPFAPLFHPKTWQKAQILLTGAILTPRKRTVTSALRVMGLAEDVNFSQYHHVLNRAVWSTLGLSQVLLHLLLQHLGGIDGPLVFGIDETLERRWGRKISARGIYRDAVRSSKSHFVPDASGRWMSLMWLTYIPWANRTWALPVLTALAPSERYYEKLGREPVKLSDRARQIIFQLRRWLPDRTLIIVADASYAVLELLDTCRTLSNPVTFITRLRLDAALYKPAEPRTPGQIGRTRLKGKRLPTLQTLLHDSKTVWSKATVNWYACPERGRRDGTQRSLEITSNTAVWYHSGKPPVPIRWVLIRDPLDELESQALLCTDLNVDAVQIIEWFVLRWQLEVTFQELRAHLGVETQRQWSDIAISRITPLLFGLFSWVTLAANTQQLNQITAIHSAAWYDKTLPTFSDAIASVRRALWPASVTFCMSPAEPEVQKVPSSLIDRLVDTLCYAA